MDKLFELIFDFLGIFVIGWMVLHLVSLMIYDTVIIEAPFGEAPVEVVVWTALLGFGIWRTILDIKSK